MKNKLGQFSFIDFMEVYCQKINGEKYQLNTRNNIELILNVSFFLNFTLSTNKIRF